MYSVSDVSDHVYDVNWLKMTPYTPLNVNLNPLMAD